MTNKLKLDMDALEVASFATQSAVCDEQGTVAANSEPIALGVAIIVWVASLFG